MPTLTAAAAMSCVTFGARRAPGQLCHRRRTAHRCQRSPTTITGTLYFDLRRYDEALAGFASAPSPCRPDYAEAHNNHGNALQELQRFDEALASYAKAIGLSPDYAQAYYNRGNTLAATQRPAAALADYEQGGRANPNHADAHRAQGVTLAASACYREALTAFESVRRLAPATDWLIGDILSVKCRICDWATDETDVAELEAAILQGRLRRLAVHRRCAFRLTFRPTPRR